MLQEEEVIDGTGGAQEGRQPKSLAQPRLTVLELSGAAAWGTRHERWLALEHAERGPGDPELSFRAGGTFRGRGVGSCVRALLSGTVSRTFFSGEARLRPCRGQSVGKGAIFVLRQDILES